MKLALDYSLNAEVGYGEALALFFLEAIAPKPKRLRARTLPGSGTEAALMLRVLMPKARPGSELLKTSRWMLGVSLSTPRKRAELSSASEEVPTAEKLPSRVSLLSKAEINAVKEKVSSTAI